MYPGQPVNTDPTQNALGPPQPFRGRGRGRGRIAQGGPGRGQPRMRGEVNWNPVIESSIGACPPNNNQSGPRGSRGFCNPNRGGFTPVQAPQPGTGEPPNYTQPALKNSTENCPSTQDIGPLRVQFEPSSHTEGSLTNSRGPLQPLSLKPAQPRTGATRNGATIQFVDRATVKQLVYSDPETVGLRGVFKFFTTKAPKVIQYIYSNTPTGEEQTNLASSFVNLSFTANVTIQLFEFLLADEFETNSAHGKEILRENGITAQFFKAYLKVVGGEYLHQMLSPLVDSLRFSEKNISFEIDPSKIPPEELFENRAAFQRKMDQFMDHLCSNPSTQAMSPGLRTLTKFVWQQAQKYRPTHPHTYVGSFLILRYINPVLFSPEMYGLIPPGTTLPLITRRNLLLISKVLQNLSNGIQTSRKEPWLNVLDTSKWQFTLHKWFTQIVDIQTNPQSVHNGICVVDQVGDLHALHCQLFRHLKHINTLIQKEDQPEFKRLVERLGDYSNKTAFASLKDKDRTVKAFLESRHEHATYLGYLDLTRQVGKKTTVETVILIIGSYRIWLLADGKVAADLHQVNLHSVKSTTPTEIQLIFDIKDPREDSPPEEAKKPAIVGESKDVERIVATLSRTFEFNFSGMNSRSRFKLIIEPSNRADKFAAIIHQSIEPCDGLVPAYRALSNFWGVPAMDALCWDLEHVYNNTKEIDFSRFTTRYVIPLRDLHAGPLFHALGYNRQFDSIKLQSYTFEAEVTFKGFIACLQNNSTLTHITFSDISGSGVTTKMMTQLFKTLEDATSLLITHLDLSGTHCDDSINALGQYFLIKRNSFIELNLSRCFKKSANVKIALNKLFNSGNRGLGLLEKLYMNGCPLGESSGDLGNLLSICPQFHELEVQETGISISAATSSPTVGLKLKRLDASKNKLKAPDYDALRHLLERGKNNSPEIILSHCEMSPLAIYTILSVPDVSPFGLIAPHNGLGLEGAKAISKALSRLNSIEKLDLSSNGFGEEGLALIFDSLTNHPTITSVDLSVNLQCEASTNQKLFTSFDLLCASTSPIEVLRFRGGEHNRLGQGAKHVLTSLAKSKTITELDVSGHHFGDVGARALSRLLYKSQILAFSYYDDNRVTPVGLAAIANALPSARSLRHMPVPFLDVSRIMSDKNFMDPNGSFKKVLENLERSLSVKAIAQQAETPANVE